MYKQRTNKVVRGSGRNSSVSQFPEKKARVVIHG